MSMNRNEERLTVAGAAPALVNSRHHDGPAPGGGSGRARGLPRPCQWLRRPGRAEAGLTAWQPTV